MSHTVKICLIADQEIEINGCAINIHTIQSIILDSKGQIESVVLWCDQCKKSWVMGVHSGCKMVNDGN